MRLHAPDEDKVYPVYLFVATLPYSQLAYVEPCLDVKEQSWINCNIHMFEYFGGVTLRIVCENLKTRVFNSCDEGVQFSATAMFILLRRKCSFRAAEMFNLGRHIQFSEKPDEDHQWSEQDIFEQMRKIIRKHEYTKSVFQSEVPLGRPPPLTEPERNAMVSLPKVTNSRTAQSGSPSGGNCSIYFRTRQGQAA